MRIVLSETGPRREDRVKRITAALLTALLASPSQSLAAQSLASMREVMPVSKDAGFSLVRLDGSEAKQVFMRAISEEALQIARERAAERGLRVTDTFTVYEIRPTAGLRKAQTEIGLEGGRVLVWDWENYDTAYTSGTMIVETWSPSTSTTFDFTYWEDDTWGATSYARFIEGRDREGRLTRALGKAAKTVNMPRLINAVFGQTTCQELTNWRSCMRECVKARLNNSMWAAVGGGIGSVRLCATNATRAGAFGPYVAAGVFMGCVLLGASMAGGIAMVAQFGSQDACDAASVCGAQPSCQ